MTVMKKKRLTKDYELSSDIGDDVIAEALRSVEKHQHRKAQRPVTPSEQLVADETQEIIINPDELFLEEEEKEQAEDANPAPDLLTNPGGEETEFSLEPDGRQRSEEGSGKKLSRQFILQLRERLESALKENAELAASLERKTLEARKNYEIALRASADLENLKKRSTREKRELEKYGCEKFLRELLPVIDNLERALQHAREAPELEVLHEGVRMTLVQFGNCLKRFGVTRIELTPGMPFDPALHEAMWEEESATCPPNTVAREVLSGYMLQDRLLRASLVSVAKPAQPPMQEGSPSELVSEQEVTLSATDEEMSDPAGQQTTEDGEPERVSSDRKLERPSAPEPRTGDDCEESAEPDPSLENGRETSEAVVETGQEKTSVTPPLGPSGLKEDTPGIDQKTRD